MRYRFHIRTANGHDKKVEIACDELDFGNAWWCKCVMYQELLATEGEEKRRVIVFAVPSEHLTMMELVE